MCVAAFAWKAHPRWRLVAIGNRDEFHDRPAAALAKWEDGSGILAGRDLKSGGTWLGVSRAGRFALITNLRGHGGPDPDRPTRGVLVRDLLSANGRYANPSEAALQDFNPFNVIQADCDAAHFLSNRPRNICTKLAHGIYGLSNGTLDEPWPKTLQLKGALLDWLNTDAENFAPLFAALHAETLPEIGISSTQPSEVPLEKRDTPVFIRDAVYGTRCSTIVAIDHAGFGVIMERQFTADSRDAGETSLTFTWPCTSL